jgi:hypothetical protein
MSVPCIKFNPEPNQVNLSDVPKSCVNLISLLDKEPLFNGTGYSGKKCKVISLEDENEVFISKIFNANAQSILGNAKQWQITEHGITDNLRLSDSNLRPLKHGLTLWVFDDIKNCSFDDLRAAYEKVVDILRNGWASENSTEIPKIVLNEALPDSHLFTKKPELTEEDVLMKSLIAKLGMGRRVKCDEYKGTMYLWIKKSELPEFVTRFFQIPSAISADLPAVKTDGLVGLATVAPKAPAGIADIEVERAFTMQMMRLVEVMRSTRPACNQEKTNAVNELEAELMEMIEESAKEKDFKRALELADGISDPDTREFTIASLEKQREDKQ